MQGRWTMAPWMRRRMARYLKRGTSERVIAYVMNPVATASAHAPIEADDWRPGDVDRSNVILFRALGGGTRAASQVR